jgi:hypothetical protein
VHACTHVSMCMCLVYQCHNVEGKWYSVLEISTQLVMMPFTICIYMYLYIKKLLIEGCKIG